RVLRLLEQQVTLRHQRFEQLEIGVVQLEGFGVQLAIDAGIGQENPAGTGLVDELQQVVRDQLDHRLRGQDHGGVQLPPRLLGSHDPVVDDLPLEENPRLIDDEELEGCDVLFLLDLRGSSLQEIKQHRLKHVGI